MTEPNETTSRVIATTAEHDADAARATGHAIGCDCATCCAVRVEAARHDATAIRAAFSRGYDRGNYGNAYESQDWHAWHAKQPSHGTTPSERSAHRDGMLLGFFSSYELHEIADEDLRYAVEVARAKWGQL